MGHLKASAFVPLSIAVITVSDSRTTETDSAGGLLVERILSHGHQLSEKHIIGSNRYALRAKVVAYIADAQTQVVLVNGGTGFGSQDHTTAALTVLLDKQIDGFGELFRQLSLTQVGSSALQSAAFAGLANGTLVVAMPGSPKGCACAWDGILAEQLDARHGPCNFVALLKQTKVEFCGTRDGAELSPVHTPSSATGA